MKTEIQKGADFTKDLDYIMLRVCILYSKFVIDTKDIKIILKDL